MCPSAACDELSNVSCRTFAVHILLIFRLLFVRRRNSPNSVCFINVFFVSTSPHPNGIPCGSRESKETEIRSFTELHENPAEGLLKSKVLAHKAWKQTTWQHHKKAENPRRGRQKFKEELRQQVWGVGSFTMLILPVESEKRESFAKIQAASSQAAEKLKSAQGEVKRSLIDSP